MDEFKNLVDTLKRLLAPDGCPWDREQTMQSMRHSLVEETFEVVEAIDLNDNRLMQEELGDLLFNAVFLCLLAEKEHRFTLQDALKHVVAKLVHRHPHIFGGPELKTSEEVISQWEEIKKGEKEGQQKSALDGIPKDLPALAKAQKIAKKLEKQKFTLQKPVDSLSNEERAGEMLWKAVQSIAQQGIQAEHALRKRLVQIESEFRNWEQLRERTSATKEEH